MVHYRDNLDVRLGKRLPAKNCAGKLTSASPHRKTVFDIITKRKSRKPKHRLLALLTDHALHAASLLLLCALSLLDLTQAAEFRNDEGGALEGNRRVSEQIDASGEPNAGNSGNAFMPVGAQTAERRRLVDTTTMLRRRKIGEIYLYRRNFIGGFYGAS